MCLQISMQLTMHPINSLSIWFYASHLQIYFSGSVKALLSSWNSLTKLLLFARVKLDPENEIEMLKKSFMGSKYFRLLVK